MKRYDLITPEGTNDYLFEECQVKREIQREIDFIFKSRGYHEVVTPGIEFYDVFDCNSNYFPQETMYKLTDNKGRLLVIRPDSTMPIARVVSTRLRDFGLPLRMYYSQTVYRNTPVMRGRSDEILQMGIELIGSYSKKADLEVITTAIEVLGSIDKNFRFELGDVGIFRELALELKTSEENLELIRNYVEWKKIPELREILSEIGENEITSAILELPNLFGGAEVFDSAKKLFKNEKILEIVENVKAIYESLSKLGYNGNITVDLGTASKMEYYTGIVMKGYIDGCGDSVLSGGRYNNLLGEFGYDVPATGFAINVDAVAKLKLQKKAYSMNVTDVIIYAEDGFEIDGILYMKDDSLKGLNVEFSVYDSLEETRKYAKRKNISKIVIVGKNITTENLEA